MDAGTFHVLPVTRSGRVIQAECDAVDQTRSELVHHESEHDGGEFFGCPSEADEAIVEAVPIVLDSGGDEQALAVRRSSARNMPAMMMARRKAILRSRQACNSATASCMGPTSGTLARVVFLRSGFLRWSRLCLSCCDFFGFLCCGCGRVDLGLRLAVRGSPGAE